MINEEHNRRAFLRRAAIASLVTGLSGSGIARAQSSGGKNSNVDFAKIPRLPLTTLPTACSFMPRLTKALGGPEIYIKRDDVMEIAHGGNKTRKLEYALADALKKGSDSVITQGGVQSNHVRQTVSAAAKTGLECHVVLSVPSPEKKQQHTSAGNYLMDVIMGANIHFAEGSRSATVEKVRNELISSGKKPYLIPAGASNGIGSLGYVNTARELIGQWKTMRIKPSHVFVASGSCGTQAGLVMGLRYFGNTKTKVVGFSVASSSESVKRRVRRVIDQICEVIDVDKGFIKDEEIIVNDEYIGEAYAYPSEEGIAAIKGVGRLEGILLDPVYTGKAMAGLIDLVRNKKLKKPKDLVFLHTGGAPALHAYASNFL
ncbi:MAG: D-cysteine desulfhydrase family protein [Pyrinomonadaceae bacterium]|nr:D-cysteine desulfhydrase family protein [Pyrinomonadaceae bacterium]